METVPTTPTTPATPTTPVVPAFTNVNGLLIDSLGVCRGIELPISNEPVTGFKRVARHEGLTIGPSMQMLQRVRIVRMTAEGKELTAAVMEMEINGNVQSQLLNAYQDTFYPASTEGAYVSTTTGLPVEPEEAGAIEQLRFFQGVTIGAIKKQGQSVTDKTSVPFLVYGLLCGEILKLDHQGRL